MEIKTSNLAGSQLDWAVSLAEGLTADHVIEFDEFDQPFYNGPRYSERWHEGGPIIEREGIELKRGLGSPRLWSAFAYDWAGNVLRSTGMTGGTPLIAAMRCYVARKLGSKVVIPVELIPPTGG